MQFSILALLALVACAVAQYSNTNYNTNQQYQTTRASTYSNGYNTANTNANGYTTNGNTQYTNGQYQYATTSSPYNTNGYNTNANTNSQYGTTSSGRQFDQTYYNSVSKASAVLSAVGVAVYALL